MDARAKARITRLRHRQDEFLLDTVERRMRSGTEQDAAREIVAQVYTRTTEPVEVLRRAEFLETFAERMPLRIEPDERIVGSMLFNVFRPARPDSLPADAPWFEGNGGHVVVDYGRVVTLGIRGLRNDVSQMPEKTGQQRHNKQAFGRSLAAFSRFIKRHADTATAMGMDGVAADCTRLAEDVPGTFQQALQLAWFTHIFLHAEASAVAISFGRIDQFLWPFLERDLADGVTSLGQAEELISCFWLKCCEGEESQNVVVGGCDSKGKSAENPLSLLCLQVTRDLQLWQPSVSVRIGPETSDHFWNESLKLCAAGFGMPSFFNDPVVIDSLGEAGIPSDRARDWAIVGCYEAVPQGDCLARTVHGQWVLPNVFLAYLQAVASDTSDGSSAPATFADFAAGLKAFMEKDYVQHLPQFQTRWDDMRRTQVSPFRSLCMPGCCENGLCAEEAGTRFNLFGVNTLGIGTLVDSLWAVKRMVYDTAEVTLAQIQAQLRDDWTDERLLSRCRSLPGKFGSDTTETNALAAEFANHVADLVLGHELRHGVQPYPALFIFTGWAQMNIPATPDGRHSGEPVSYGVGPSIYCGGKTPTSVLNSAALTANNRCGCGNPMFLTLNEVDVRDDSGLARLRQTVEAFFRQGGFHLHMNILDAEKLRAAQRHPEQHADLLIRISGLSAQFVTLDKRLQNALIERAEQGI